MNGQETEVKFFVKDLQRIEAGLLKRQARLVQARVLERNLRFDLPDGTLSSEGRVLRLRQDAEARMTYKGPSETVDGANSRVELEFTIGDLDTARQVLEALGYVQIAVYEKYRAVYDLGDCHIMLDELPYGSFVEIEGPDGATIRKTATELGLDMSAAAADSYLGIFDKYCQKRGWSQSKLTFDSLRGVTIDLADLNIRAADRQVTPDSQA
jgi:adenylate cyclase class 2